MKLLKTKVGWINPRFLIVISPEEDGRHSITFQVGDSIDHPSATTSDVTSLMGGDQLR